MYLVTKCLQMGNPCFSHWTYIIIISVHMLHVCKCIKQFCHIVLLYVGMLSEAKGLILHVAGVLHVLFHIDSPAKDILQEIYVEALNVQSAYKRGTQSRAIFFLTLPVQTKWRQRPKMHSIHAHCTHCVPMKGKKLSTSLTQHKAKAKHRTGLRVRATASWQLASKHLQPQLLRR